MNVGQGSSIIIEYQSANRRNYGVIDSNCSANDPNKTNLKLESLGATALSFVALTHPHRDHYSGLYDIILKFKDKIDTFYSCPFGDLVTHRDRLDKLRKHLLGLVNDAGNETHRRAAYEFLQVLMWADKGRLGGTLEWNECAGDENAIAPEGFAGVNIHTLTPARFSKGHYVERIDSNDPLMFGNIDDNDISLSFRIEYQNHVVVLGGDASKSAWSLRQKYERQSGKRIDAAVVNLPHHGSSYDCPPDVMERLFALQGNRFGISSADGTKHPSIEAIDWLYRNEIDPYCTNLIAECGNNTQKIYPMGNLDKEFARKLRETAKSTKHQMVCQGDVVITIANGQVNVSPEFNHYCPFRRSSPSLF